jgi:Cu(I)/Ag(I) efflux system membrane protein CusA/SilA
MVNRIVAWCIAHSRGVLVATVVLAAWGAWAVGRAPLDAIPDVSDVQVIVSTEWSGRSPDLVEAQVTYPLVSALAALPEVRTVRGTTEYGISSVFVIFQDSTDLYFARARVLERLVTVAHELPDGAVPVLGPDATSVGWVFQYAIVDTAGTRSLDELRSLQDWTVRLALSGAPGVAEVASIGGFVKEYQVNLDPDRLSAHGLTPMNVVRAIRASNDDAEGRLIERAGREYVVRIRGYLHTLEDLRSIGLGADTRGEPVRVGDVAEVRVGPGARRGLAELDGQGEAVGGIVVMRAGENALAVVDAVKRRLDELRPTLPKGIEILPVYDRSTLIRESVHALSRTLLEEAIVVAVIVMVFLSSLRASAVVILIMPLAAAAALIPLAYGRQSVNIMSLGGIALALGVLIDAAIVIVENTHRALAVDGSVRGQREVVVAAATRVARPVFFSLLIVVLSFLPVFLLQSQEGRMFRPLVLTKTLSVSVATLLAVMVVPALLALVMPRGGGVDGGNAATAFVTRLYEPVLAFALRRRGLCLLVNASLLPIAAVLFAGFGQEFMPAINEGTLLYMPTAAPGISVTEVRRNLQIQDRILAGFPEVEHVFGSAGRSTSATDNSPIGMMNTTIMLKPRSAWRPGLDLSQLIEEMDGALQLPGFANTWTQPISGRVDMLSTGIKSAVGVKILGADPLVLGSLGQQIAGVLEHVQGTRSVYAERVDQGYFVDVQPDRDRIARFGLSMADVTETIQAAVGGATGGRILEGRERYPILVRYMHDYRSDLTALGGIRLLSSSGADVTLRDIAAIATTTGPAFLRNENGRLASYVYVDPSDSDVTGFVARAQRAVASAVRLPSGYSVQWSGRYEAAERSSRRLRVIIPCVLGLIFVILCVALRSVKESAIVMVSVLYAMTGGVLLQWWTGYNLSVAVWVGYIALFGTAVQTGVIMVVYLQEALTEAQARLPTVCDEDVYRATMEGAVQRLRPKLMTVSVTILGLAPLLWGSGVGGETLRPVAIPMVGGMITSAVHVLLITPVIFYMVHRGGRTRVRPAAVQEDV